MQKTLNLDIPWLFNEPRLDYKARRKMLPVLERNGVECWVPFSKQLLAPFSWWFAQKTVRVILKEIADNQDGYLENDFKPAVPCVLRQLLSAVTQRDKEALSRMCSPGLYDRLWRAVTDIDNARAKVEIAISPVSDGVNQHRDFDVQIADLWMKVAPKSFFQDSVSTDRSYSVFRFSTCTVIRDDAAEKQQIKDLVEKANGSTPGIKFLISHEFRPGLYQFRIDARVIAHVMYKIEIPPVAADATASTAPMVLLDDKKRVDIVLTFISNPIALKPGDSTDELGWQLADLDYTLESEQQANPVQ